MKNDSLIKILNVICPRAVVGDSTYTIEWTKQADRPRLIANLKKDGVDIILKGDEGTAARANIATRLGVSVKDISDDSFSKDGAPITISTPHLNNLPIFKKMSVILGNFEKDCDQYEARHAGGLNAMQEYTAAIQRAKHKLDNLDNKLSSSEIALATQIIQILYGDAPNQTATAGAGFTLTITATYPEKPAAQTAFDPSQESKAPQTKPPVKAAAPQQKNGAGLFSNFIASLPCCSSDNDSDHEDGYGSDSERDYSMLGV